MQSILPFRRQDSIPDKTKEKRKRRAFQNQPTGRWSSPGDIVATVWGHFGRCFSVGILLLVLLNSQAQAKKPVDTKAQKASMSEVFADFEHVPDVVYKTVEDQALQMDLLIPKNLPKTPAPLLVHIHGGAWSRGNRYVVERPDHVEVVKRCGKAGIICATIEYRLTNGKVTAYDSVVDCKDALRYLVKHAKEYRIDASRIATFGGSAGGHLSLMTALGDPKDFLGDPALASYDPASVRCELAFYPATDFTDPLLTKRFLAPNRAAIIFGGTAQEKADLLRLLSPMHHIYKNSPPVYLIHGDKDPILTVENSRRLFRKGKALGADIQFTEVKNGVHGFGPDCTPSIEKISEIAAQFLIERLTR